MNLQQRMFGVILVLWASFVSAVELKSDARNYSFTVPEGWTVNFESPAGFSVNSQDRRKTIVLLISKTISGDLDSKTMSQLERVFAKTGAEVLSNKTLTNNGVPVHEIVSRMGKQTNAATLIERFIVADRNMYVITATRWDGDAISDVDIQTALASFHFLHRPSIPFTNATRWKIAIATFIIVVIGLVAWALIDRANRLKQFSS